MSELQPQERRKSQNDRRTATRGGKYDRRRNRCIACRHFEEHVNPIQAPQGYCQKHHTPLAADAFACILFEPIA